MKVKCGSCGSEYPSNIAECDNCGFPNRAFATPLKGTTSITMELDLILSMEEYCKRVGKSIDDAYTNAVQLFLMQERRRKTS